MRSSFILVALFADVVTQLPALQAAEPACRPHVIVGQKYGSSTGGSRPAAVTSGPWAVPNLCYAYKIPKKLSGNGVIGILELGGGWVQSDLDAFSMWYGMPKINVVNVSVDGTQNNPGADLNADAEVALDIQVAAGTYYYATGTVPTIYVFYAANSYSSFANVINAAVNKGCDVLSISWGNYERVWKLSSSNAATNLESAASSATAAGLTIFAASGDYSSSDGGNGSNVDLPAACPHIIACGGTTKTTSSEVVWGTGVPTDPGTGGGFSSIFATQSFQSGVPSAPAGLGRMVPDLSANADPSTGYLIALRGSQYAVGGTSAVAPFYAGYFAAVGKKLGFISPKLWANKTAFNDVTSGSNGAYTAATGPDACSGLGTPNGQAIVALYNNTTVPASNVLATLSPGILTLVGDGGANTVNASVSGGVLTVQGSNGTTINGSATYTAPVTGNFSLNVDMGGGDDSISFTGIPGPGLTSYVLLGAGNDKIQILLSNLGTLSIDGGTGVNTLVTTSSTIGVLGKVNF